MSTFRVYDIRFIFEPQRTKKSLLSTLIVSTIFLQMQIHAMQISPGHSVDANADTLLFSLIPRANSALFYGFGRNYNNKFSIRRINKRKKEQVQITGKAVLSNPLKRTGKVMFDKNAFSPLLVLVLKFPSSESTSYFP